MKEGSIVTKPCESYFFCKPFHLFFVLPDYRQVYRHGLEVGTKRRTAHPSIVVGTTISTEYSKRRIKTPPKNVKVTKQSRFNCKFSRATTCHLFRLEMFPRPCCVCVRNLFPMVINHQRHSGNVRPKKRAWLTAVTVKIKVIIFILRLH
jgi:hypothetical protein